MELALMFENLFNEINELVDSLVFDIDEDKAFFKAFLIALCYIQILFGIVQYNLKDSFDENFEKKG